MMYILEGHDPILEEDVIAWAQWMAMADRHVAQDWIGDVRVSTVFTGINYNFFDLEGHDPITFETMIFGGPFDLRAFRYRTWEEAELGHQGVIQYIQEDHDDQADDEDRATSVGAPEAGSREERPQDGPEQLPGPRDEDDSGV